MEATLAAAAEWERGKASEEAAIAAARVEVANAAREVDAARAEAAAELEAARKARASLAGIEKALEERETYLVESWRRRR